MKSFTPEMKGKMKRLQEFKQTFRKEFDKAPQNQKRLDDLKDYNTTSSAHGTWWVRLMPLVLSIQRITTSLF